MAKLPIKGTIPHGRTTSSEDLPLKVTDSGGLGVLNVTGGGGGTEYAEDTAHVSGDLGTQVLAVRNDAGTALAGTDGDYIPLSTDNTGALRVTGGGGGTQYTEGDVDATITGNAGLIESKTNANKIVTLQGHELTNSNALAVEIVDGSGTQITSFGGGTQYTEADTDASITGTAVMWEDTSDTLRAVSASKPLPVNVVTAQQADVNIVSVSESLLALGQNTMSSSLPVVIASNQSAVPISASSLPLPTGASTLAEQQTQTTALQLLDDTVGTTSSAVVSKSILAGIRNSAGNQDVFQGQSTNADDVAVSAAGKHVQVAGFNYVYDGTAWDRQYGDATNGTLVNLGANNDITVTSGSISATQSGTWDVGSITTNIIPGTGSTSLGKAEDAAHSSGDTGVMVLAVRQDTASALAGTSGDYIPLTTDSAGYLRATTVLTTISGGKEVAKLEDAASGDGDSGIPALAVRKATPANTSGTDGDYEFLQMSAGRLWTSATIDTALPAGTNGIGKLTANSGVDIGDVDVTSVIPGTGATNLGKAEDAAHSSSDTGVFALGVRNDTLATTFAGTTGDYSGIATDSLGAVWVRNVAYIDSGTTLTAINTTYNNVTTTASSADITIPTGSRMCDLIMTIDSTLAPTDITFHIEAKDGSTYFRMKNGFLGKFIFDDTAVATAQDIHVTFPCPMTGTMRVTAVATGTDATNYFVVSNAKLFFRS